MRKEKCRIMCLSASLALASYACSLETDADIDGVEDTSEQGVAALPPIGVYVAPPHPRAEYTCRGGFYQPLEIGAALILQTLTVQPGAAASVQLGVGIDLEESVFQEDVEEGTCRATTKDGRLSIVRVGGRTRLRLTYTETSLEHEFRVPYFSASQLTAASRGPSGPEDGVDRVRHLEWDYTYYATTKTVSLRNLRSRLVGWSDWVAGPNYYDADLKLR